MSLHHKLACGTGLFAVTAYLHGFVGVVLERLGDPVLGTWAQHIGAFLVVPTVVMFMATCGSWPGK